MEHFATPNPLRQGLSFRVPVLNPFHVLFSKSPLQAVLEGLYPHFAPLTDLTRAFLFTVGDHSIEGYLHLVVAAYHYYAATFFHIRQPGESLRKSQVLKFRKSSFFVLTNISRLSTYLHFNFLCPSSIHIQHTVVDSTKVVSLKSKSPVSNARCCHRSLFRLFLRSETPMMSLTCGGLHVSEECFSHLELLFLLSMWRRSLPYFVCSSFIVSFCSWLSCRCSGAFVLYGMFSIEANWSLVHQWRTIWRAE